jgi:hypothetical protein
MMYLFPHDEAFLPRTKLSYINLPGLLADGKRDRTARVSGFVQIQLGERCFLVFMRNGEPFHSACIQPESRTPAALSEVLRLVATESERGENGQIAYFAATEAQLAAMLATLLQEPLHWDQPLDDTRPELLFPRLREMRFTGILELFDGRRYHFLEFVEGTFRTGWFAERGAETPIPEFMRALFSGSPGSLRTGLYPSFPELPVQAGPGLVDLYRRLIGGVLRELTSALGRETALGVIRKGQAVAAMERPEVSAFQVTDEGRVSGDPVATPATLTDGVAAWLTESLVAASDHHGVDPAALIERVARESRFVLAENGFFSRIPWALAL